MTDNITVQELRRYIKEWICYWLVNQRDERLPVALAAFDALADKAARTDALEAENAALVKERDQWMVLAEKAKQDLHALGAARRKLAQAHDKAAHAHAFDAALDALHSYQQNWDTGLPAAYAEGERVMMECACEKVREALEDAKADFPNPTTRRRRSR